jgi:hypothetical protein
MSRVYSARVRGGVNNEREAALELTPAELDDAIADADRSESISSAVVLAELDRITSTARR